MHVPANIDLVIDIKTEINLSESYDKVLDAVSQIAEIKDKIPMDKNMICISTSDSEILRKIYRQVRSKAIVSALRKLLLKNMDGNTTRFYLNKQAATAGVISLVETPEESPLGPITVSLASSELQQVIDWLAPELKSEKKDRIYSADRSQ
jgi:predicted RNA binding protein with dsRBD fold (UPF0201 family)